MFFFEKKNQKTFARLLATESPVQRGKRLFASYSSEKKESF